ncbi:MAG: hypothetical protein ACI4MQ_04645 [Candidatus Coproplasma sp.]
MGVLSELYAIGHSFSADRQVQHQSRSGDEQDGGALVIDFVANVQSAEADIIETEEREEQAESKRKFAKLLVVYFKRILTAQEYKFLIACMRENKTPNKIGQTMGLDYRSAIESIRHKNEANKDKLAALMQACGYDYRRGLDFLPSFRRYIHKNDYGVRYGREHNATKVEYNRKRRANDIGYAACCRKSSYNYYTAHRDEINARRRAIQGEQREKNRKRCRVYDGAHKVEKSERMRIYRETHRKELLRKKKAYYAAHRDEINAKRRNQRRLKKEAQERAEGV